MAIFRFREIKKLAYSYAESLKSKIIFGQSETFQEQIKSKGNSTISILLKLFKKGNNEGL